MAHQPVTPITSDRLSTLAVPRMACKNSTSSSDGTLPSSSVRRIMAVSSHGAAMPLTAPYTTAMTVDTAAARNPTASDTRPPYQMQAKISRPMVSVPNQNCPDGAAAQLARSI